MSFSLLFALAVVGYLSLVSVVIILLWHSYPSGSILGGLVLMWAMITIFLAIVFFTEKKSSAAENSDETSGKKPPSTLNSAKNL